MATEDWRRWLIMALNSQSAALKLQQDQPRSCVSRIYYSAYQAVTAVLLYAGASPPSDREAWSHDLTPQLIIDKWETLIPSLDRRKDLEARLKTLYKLRIAADYKASDTFEVDAVQKAVKDGNFLINNAINILPGV